MREPSTETIIMYYYTSCKQTVIVMLLQIVKTIILIILQVNINGFRNKLEELKLLIHDTHADIITFQETKLTPKAKNTKNT